MQVLKNCSRTVYLLKKLWFLFGWLLDYISAIVDMKQLSIYYLCINVQLSLKEENDCAFNAGLLLSDIFKKNLVTLCVSTSISLAVWLQLNILHTETVQLDEFFCFPSYSMFMSLILSLHYASLTNHSSSQTATT